jgi:hypothetical protein
LKSDEIENVSDEHRRRTLSATLAITLIGIAPAWSQRLLETLDPNKNGTADLTEAKIAAGKLFGKGDRDHDGTLDERERPRISPRPTPTTIGRWTRMKSPRW